MKRTPDKKSESRKLVDKSSALREFLAEKEEILRHKWIESERLGYDIGFYRARLDWNRNHRNEWRKQRMQLQSTP